MRAPEGLAGSMKIWNTTEDSMLVLGKHSQKSCQVCLAVDKAALEQDAFKTAESETQSCCHVNLQTNLTASRAKVLGQRTFALRLL